MSIERLIPYKIEDKNKIITVTGVSASGKNYLVDRAIEYEPELFDGPITVFDFGSELLRSIVKDLPDLEFQERDCLKNLPIKIIDAYIQETLKRLLQSQPTLQLTHLVFRQQKLLNINPNSERTTNATEYIFIESDPDLIYSWRFNEFDERQREIESIDEIRLHQSIAKATTLAIAQHFNAGMLLIHNDPLYINNNVSAIIEDCMKILNPRST